MTFIAELLTAVTYDAAVATNQRVGRMALLPVADMRRWAPLMTVRAVVRRPIVALATLFGLSGLTVNLKPILTGMRLRGLLARVALDALIGRSVAIVALVQARLHLRSVKAPTIEGVNEISVTRHAIHPKNLDMRAVRYEQIASRSYLAVGRVAPLTRLSTRRRE